MERTASPLAWPSSYPRREPSQRKRARFSKLTHSGRWNSQKSLTIHEARLRLEGELDRLGARDVILSTNLALRLDGLPRSGQVEPEDPGVALYFKLKGRDIVMPCDRYDRVADNIAAIAAHIEASRKIERHGVGSLEQIFMGFQALPAPEQWWDVLGCSPQATSAEIRKAWKARISESHPDRGGSEAEASRVNWAREEGMKQARDVVAAK